MDTLKRENRELIIKNDNLKYRYEELENSYNESVNYVAENTNLRERVF
jgi:hypothetical protein